MAGKNCSYGQHSCLPYFSSFDRRLIVTTLALIFQLPTNALAANDPPDHPAIITSQTPNTVELISLAGVNIIS